jgi:SPP1 gp7 family putative phage head morphogenesis protein
MKEASYGLTGDFIFRSAVEFLKKKTPLTEEEYKSLSDECRAKAFTVSGYTGVEVLQKFLDELTDACENGSTKKEFADNMNDFLERNGFEGLDPFHADVIFRTNMQTAYNAGHYKSMTDPTTKKLRPYWKYVTAGDGNVRESHAAMEGRIYAADDPIWDIWYPPNGFRCRCTVVSLTKRQAENAGVPVSRDAPYNVDYSTGEIRYQYPDKGFSNNPAKDAWKPDLTGVDAGLKKAFRERERQK